MWILLCSRGRNSIRKGFLTAHNLNGGPPGEKDLITRSETACPVIKQYYISFVTISGIADLGRFKLRKLVLIFFVMLSPATDFAQERVVRYFPGNEKYGFIKKSNPKFQESADYFIVTTDASRLSNDIPYIIIDSIRSTMEPQLCDSNAISYIIRRNDSAFLATAFLSQPMIKDTIISLIQLNSRLISLGSNGQWHDRILNELAQYCFRLKDSILSWHFSFMQELFAIGRIDLSGNIIVLISGSYADGPYLTNDFKQILFSVPSDQSVYDFCCNGSRILAYDITLKDTISLFESDRGCYGARKRCRDCALYCIAESPVDDGVDLCRIKKDSLLPLAHYVRPTGIVDYYLYHDSIVVLTRKHCNSAHGVSSQVVPDSE
jgi:hypothetical protein